MRHTSCFVLPSFSIHIFYPFSSLPRQNCLPPKRQADDLCRLLGSENGTIESGLDPPLVEKNAQDRENKTGESLPFLVFFLMWLSFHFTMPNTAP